MKHGDHPPISRISPQHQSACDPPMPCSAILIRFKPAETEPIMISIASRFTPRARATRIQHHESTPEPNPGFVQTTMPKLTRLLLGSEDEELLKSSTTALKNIVAHDHQQLFTWQDSDGKAGLEVVLVIISRLLSTNVNDNAASEVGALAAEVVEKAGHERLGPYLEELLRTVAARLASAEHAPFIQSLTLVFARLSLQHAAEVVSFLANQNINGENGLQVVLAKWLENSISFAGYDEIRQK